MVYLEEFLLWCIQLNFKREVFPTCIFLPSFMRRTKSVMLPMLIGLFQHNFQIHNSIHNSIRLSQTVCFMVPVAIISLMPLAWSMVNAANTIPKNFQKSQSLVKMVILSIKGLIMEEL